MPDCEHCGESFEDEDAYLDHLGEEHWDDLGRIDRRRVERHRGDDGGISRVGVMLGALAVFLVALLVFVTVFQGGGDENRPETAPLPDSGAQGVIDDVQTEPDQGRTHVDPGTDIEYETLPPSGGTHYPPPHSADAGFYEQSPPLGELVHSLEHGAVIVWYDPAVATASDNESMRTFARNNQRSFGSFIAVPTPVEDPDHPFVVTAWERRLTLEEYDVTAIRQFMGEYLGRGPEGAYR